MKSHDNYTSINLVNKVVMYLPKKHQPFNMEIMGNIYIYRLAKIRTFKSAFVIV